MPTKIQQIAVMLNDLDNSELECIRSIANQVIEKRRGTNCMLLQLPAELRNLIYEFVARDHIDRYGCYENGKGRCGLFGVNKQLRAEFMDVCYDEDIVGEVRVVLPEFHDAETVKTTSLKELQGQKIKKLLLDGGEGVDILSWDSLQGAETWAKCYIETNTWKLARGEPREEAKIFGIRGLEDEVDGEVSAKYLVFSITKKAILENGLEDELPVFDDGAKLI